MKCAFCTIHSVYKHKYRQRAQTEIVNEILHCNREYAITHFDFEDDNLSGVYFENLLDKLLEANLKNCSFSAMNGIPYLTLTKTIIGKMKSVGFTHIDISLATVSGIMNRQTNLEQFERVVSWANEYGLPVNAYFILGLPQLDFNENLAIIKFLSKLNVQIGPSIYYTVPGIPYYKETMPDILCRSTAVYQFPESKIAREEVILLFRLCRAINFLKKKNKTEFEQLIEEKTRQLGLFHLKKEKQNYKYIEVKGADKINNFIKCIN
jgi:radical SAM superfamily enzyme YgiQ (UPF0313 family)